MKFSEATIKDVLRRLDDVKGSSPQYYAKCPAHDDRNASLSIKEGDARNVLIKCHAGCEFKDIVAAMGFDVCSTKKPSRTIVAEYKYMDDAGQLLFVKVRFDPKDFRIKRPDGKGGWIWNLEGTEKVLYRLPEVINAVSRELPVFVVEGEKDADTLAARGFCATCNFDGAGKWLPSYNQVFRGAKVYIIPDNDKPGQDHAQLVANNLLPLAEEVRIIDLMKIDPDLTEHGDITDYITRSPDKEAGWREFDNLVSITNPTTIKLPADEWERSVKPADYSDAGNAEVFGSFYHGKLIFVDALGWLFWNGKQWERSDHQALAMALDLSGLMHADALSKYTQALHAEADAKAACTTAEDDEAKEALTKAKIVTKAAKSYLTHANYTRNNPRLQSMLALSKPALVVRADTLDADPFDLNTPTGIVNLRTGKIRPHDPEAYCSRITEAAPGLEGAETWQEFLELVTGGDVSIQGFLQLIAGMAAVGTVYHEGIILAYGGGGNGKSTFFNSLGAVFGDYSGTIDVKTLTTDRQNKGASLATLRGRRLVITGELEEHQRLSVAILKQLGSTDELTVEEKFKPPETIKQSHTLCLFTNHLPRVGSTDNGTWRRLTVVPFGTQIPKSTDIQNYTEVLVEKAGGAIMSWIIEGAVNFCRNKFKLDIPEVVAEATENYRSQEDWLSNFIDDRCVRDRNAKSGARELYLAYSEWCMEIGDFKRREREFAAAMEIAGFQNIKPQNKSTWKGLKLNMSRSFENPYGATG